MSLIIENPFLCEDFLGHSDSSFENTNYGNSSSNRFFTL